MKPLLINFAPRSALRSVFSTSLLVKVLAVALLSILIGSMIALWEVKHQRDTIFAQQQQIIAQRARSASKPLALPSNIAAPQATSVNQAVMQLNIPWRQLWGALESSTPSTIALLAVEPDVNRRRLHLLAEASTSEQMLNYVSQLKIQPFFRSVALLRHEINDADPQKPVRFQVDAHWMGQPP